MIFMYEYMQRIVIKNLTDDTLTDIKLTHNGTGSGNYSSEIKKIKSNESKETELFTLRAFNHCNLILTYTYKNITNTVIVYDKLIRSDLRFMLIEVREINGEITINTFKDNDLWDR